MGGGMVYGEPMDYGFRYPYRASGTPAYSSAFPPRRQPSFWGEDTYPEEVTNLARKRKLDGVKGEPLGLSNGRNVREIFVEDPSLSRIPRAHDDEDSVQAHENASPSSRRGDSSPPFSPPRSFRSGSVNSEGPIGSGSVTIPVLFSSDGAEQEAVPVVAPEGTKKPRRMFSEEAAAGLIQAAFRGYSLRRSKPLDHMKRINSIRNKLKDFERQLSQKGIVEKMRTDVNAGLRITEGIMALLLQLDSIQGVHPDVRVWRKSVTKEVVTLQERVDVLLKGGEVLETGFAVVESSVEVHDGDSAMVLEENLVKDVESQSDDVMVKSATQTPQPEPQVSVDDSLEEKIVLDKLLKLEENEDVMSPPDEMAILDVDLPGDFDTRVGEATGVSDPGIDHCTKTTNMQEQLKRGEESVARDEVVVLDRSEGRYDQAERSTSQDANSSKSLEAGGEISTCQPTNEHSEAFTETMRRRDDELRLEDSANYVMEEAENASDRCTDGFAALQTKGSDASDIVDAKTIQEDEWGGMVVDREEFQCQNPIWDQEKMKDFIREISNLPSEGICPIPDCVQQNDAEEMDCLDAPGTNSDLEENDGAVASASSQLKDRSVDTDAAAEKREHDLLLLKFSEENKMLKSLILNVMKWNQLQANNMRNVTERLGKLENLLKKKSSSKPKAQRCTRSKLERRLRR